MLTKSLIQFSAEERGSVPSLLFELRPNYCGGNEDNCALLQNVSCMNCYTQCFQPYSRPPPTHASAIGSWTLMGKFGSFICGVTALLSWVLMHTRICLWPPRVHFPSPVYVWQHYRGLMETSSKRAYVISLSTAPRAPVPTAVHC